MVLPASRHRLPLLLPLLVAVALELALHRVALQFLKPQVLEPESDLFRLFNGGVGPLFFFFASFLALAACTWILMVVVREDGVFTLPWRVVLGLFSCVFLPVCAVGAFVSQAGLSPLSHSLRELHPYLNLFFAPMLAAVAAGLLTRRAPVLPKVGVVLLIAPILGYAYFSYRTAAMLGQGPGGAPIFEQLRQVSAIPQQLRTAFLYSGPWVFLAFVPLVGLVERAPDPAQATGRAKLLGTLRTYGQVLVEPGPMITGLCVGVLLGIGIKVGYAPLRIVADAALAYDLPTPSAGALLALGSLGLFAWTVAALAWRPGPTRTVAAGLVCMGVAGMRLAEPLHSLQLPEPLYYLLAVVGLLALAVGVVGAWDRAEEWRLTAHSPAIPDPRWLAFLQRTEAALGGGPDAGMLLRRVAEQEVELTGLEGRWRGLPLVLYFRRRGGRVESFSLVIGESLDQRADWLAAVTPAGAAPDGDAPAPGRLRVRDRAGLDARLLRDGFGERLAEQLRGEVELWLHVGLRYRFLVRDAATLAQVLPVAALADPSGGEPPPGRLLALCDLLHELAQRAGVQPRPGAEEPAAPPP